MRRILQLGWPLATGYVAQLSISFTDVVLISHVGPMELAGMALALSIFTIVSLGALGIVSAVTPRIAMAHKSGDPYAASAWAWQGGWLAILISVPCVALLLATGPIVIALGQDSDVAELAFSYNRGAALGLPLFLLYVAIRCFLTAVDIPKYLTWVMLASIPVNVGVGYIAVFGIAGASGAGIAGAGVASSITRLLILAAAIVVLVRVPDLAPYRENWHTACKISVSNMRVLIARGSPIGIRIMLGEGFTPVLALIAASFGAGSLAVHTIGVQIESLAVVLALGFSNAATAMSAWAKQDNDWVELRNLHRALLKLSIVYGIPVAVVIVVFRNAILEGIFDLTDSETINQSTTVLRYVAIYLILDVSITIMMGFFVGLDDTFIPAVAVAIGYWIIGLGTGIFLGHVAELGLSGLWIGTIVGAGSIAIFIHHRAINRIGNMRNQTIGAENVETRL